MQAELGPEPHHLGLAFFLAFSFGITADHFERRRQIVLDEANAIGTTHRRAR